VVCSEGYPVSRISTKIILLLLVTLITVVNQIVNADVFLTSENLNSALKQMQRSQLQIQKNEDYELALYTLGKTADDLAKLLTDEVEAHANENEKLIELALDRTKGIQINIFWEGQKSRFFYDGKILNEYLEQYPEGQYRMDSLYRTITRDFFLLVPDGENELKETIERKESFKNKYPDFANLSEIEFYLAIDYRDLWRHYRDIKALNLADQMAITTSQQLQLINEKYRDKDEGEIARRLLERFLVEAEVEITP
jgi:hypothetical protein